MKLAPNEEVRRYWRPMNNVFFLFWADFFFLQITWTLNSLCFLLEPSLPSDSSSHWSLSHHLCPLPSLILLTGSLRLQNNLNVICSWFRNPLLFPGTKGCKVHFSSSMQGSRGTDGNLYFQLCSPQLCPIRLMTEPSENPLTSWHQSHGRRSYGP